MKIKIKLTIITAIVFIFLAIICGCLENEINNEKTITIEGKNQFYSTIKDAINESSAGDKIIISKGIYNEKLIIDKSIKLIGENKEETIINGSKTGDVIYVLADNVTISGFSIQGSGSNYSYGVDAAIDISSNDNTITNNNIFLNDNYGIYLSSNSRNNLIVNNSISENKYGIYLNYAQYNNISTNNFSLNTDYGIYFGSQSNNNQINDNVFFENQCGVRIKGSLDNKIKQNLFKNNERGLYFCCGARDNIIFLNNFINNSDWNARDGSINKWDNGTHGNYWDDYSGIDNDSNDIGDTPYEISSNIDKLDIYPLMETFEKYIIK